MNLTHPWSNENDVILRLTAPDEVLNELEVSLNGDLVNDLFVKSVEKIEENKFVFVFHIHHRYRMVEGRWEMGYEGEMGLNSHIVKLERIDTKGDVVRQLFDISTLSEHIGFITKKLEEARELKNKIVKIAESVGSRNDTSNQ